MKYPPDLEAMTYMRSCVRENPDIDEWDLFDATVAKYGLDPHNDWVEGHYLEMAEYILQKEEE